jgi:hypothetical protein
MARTGAINEPNRAALLVDARMNRVRHFIRTELRALVMRFSNAGRSGHQSADHRAENCRFHSASRDETASGSSSSLGPYLSRVIWPARPGRLEQL